MTAWSKNPQAEPIKKKMLLHSKLNSISIWLPPADVDARANGADRMVKRRRDAKRGVKRTPRTKTPLNIENRLYDHLRLMIVGGSLLPGERVVPEQLAQEMGVSRTPILSALKRLTQDSLLEWRPRRGVFVRRLSPRELALVFEVREMLEGLAARRAATRIGQDDVQALRELFRGIPMEDAPANRRNYLVRDWEFHTHLLRLADSAPLTNTMQSVNIMVLAFGGGVLRPLREVMAEHEAIFDALAKRDPDAAEIAMRIHIRRSVTFLHGQADMAEEAAAALGSAAPDGRLPERNRTGRLSVRGHHVPALD